MDLEGRGRGPYEELPRERVTRGEKRLLPYPCRPPKRKRDEGRQREARGSEGKGREKGAGEEGDKEQVVIAGQGE